MRKRSKVNRFTRNAAFSMNLVNPESDETDAIHSMLTLKGHQMCFLENSIAEVLPASIIDPDNKEPDTRHSYQFKYSIGSRNPIIARTILQAKDVLDSVSFNSGLNKQMTLDHVWECTHFLIHCHKSYSDIFSDTTKLMSECDKIVNQGKVASYIPSLPQVKNLEERVVTFLGYGKRFLETSHELLCIFYGSDFKGSKFHEYRKWMEENRPSKTEVITFLEQEKDWIKLLASYRNALDINHSKPGFEVIIENFKLCTGNKFTNPSWRYDFSGQQNGDVQDEPRDLIVTMNVFVTNMWTFFEELFLLCVKDNWDNRCNYEIYRHKKEDINAKCPTLYYISRNQK